MNRNRDIIETRKLAAKGRNGDNMIGEVDGAPAHINAYEAYLLDKYGKAGEEVVKDIGAGTTNPETGMKEYHGSMLGGAFGKPKGHPLHHLSMTNNVVADALDWLVPTEGTGFFSSDTGQAEKASAGNVVGQGMQVLLEKQKREMGPQGFITQGQQMEEAGIQDTYGTTREGITAAEQQLKTGTNLAFSGEVEAKIDKMTGQAESQYGLNIGESRMKADKAESDFMSNLREQMNRMMMDYQSITEEAYGGGQSFDELNKAFDEFYYNTGQ